MAMRKPCSCCTCTDCACCAWRRVFPGTGEPNSNPPDGCITGADLADVCCGKVYEVTWTVSADLRWRPSSTGAERVNRVIGSFTVRFTVSDTPGFPTLCDKVAEEVSNSMTVATNIQSSPGVFCVPGGLATSLPVPIEYVIAHAGTTSAAYFRPGCRGVPVIVADNFFCAATPVMVLAFVDAIIGYTLQEGGYTCGGAGAGTWQRGWLGSNPFGARGLCSGSTTVGTDTETWASSANVASGSLSWRLHTFYGNGASQYANNVSISWSRTNIEPCPCGCSTNGDGPEIGACCLPSGECIESSKAACTSLGGTWRSGDCATVERCPPPTGACCDPDTGACSQTTRAGCVDGNNYLGDGTDCEDCPAIGACCDPTTGECSRTTEADCNGAWYEDLECDDPAVLDCGDVNGGCCLPDGTCVNTTGSGCFALGGVFNLGQVCGSFSCERGACCLPGGGCVFTTATDCGTQAGFYLGDGTFCVGGGQCLGCCCAEDGTPIGNISQSACIAAGGTWHGVGTTCSGIGSTDTGEVVNCAGTDAGFAPLMAPARVATRPARSGGCGGCGADKGLF